jgi:hypothetical protein
MARPRSAGLRSRGDAHLVTCLAARHFLADAIRCGALPPIAVRTTRRSAEVMSRIAREGAQG